MSPDSPIAILDSGVGGLAVVRALSARLPHERILYFGDTARTPYGLEVRRDGDGVPAADRALSAWV
jgi:glutamate racemase